MATQSITVPQRSSLRLSAYFEDDEGSPVVQAAVVGIKIVAYSTADRATLTLDQVLDKAVILDTPVKDAAGRPVNFRFTTPAAALPEAGLYELVVRVDFGSDRIAAEIFAVSVIQAG